MPSALAGRPVIAGATSARCSAEGGRGQEPGRLEGRQGCQHALGREAAEPRERDPDPPEAVGVGQAARDHREADEVGHHVVGRKPAVKNVCAQVLAQPVRSCRVRP